MSPVAPDPIDRPVAMARLRLVALAISPGAGLLACWAVHRIARDVVLASPYSTELWSWEHTPAIVVGAITAFALTLLAARHYHVSTHSQIGAGLLSVVWTPVVLGALAVAAQLPLLGAVLGAIALYVAIPPVLRGDPFGRHAAHKRPPVDVPPRP